MVNNDNIQKRNSMLFLTRFILIIFLPFVLLELVVAIWGGLAYFLLFFWLFHAVLTGILLFERAVRRLSKIILGSKINEINIEMGVKQRLPKWYRTYWLISNIAFLVIVVISFSYNVRLIDWL